MRLSCMRKAADPKCRDGIRGTNMSLAVCFEKLPPAQSTIGPPRAAMHQTARCHHRRARKRCAAPLKCVLSHRAVHGTQQDGRKPYTPKQCRKGRREDL
eukprot:5238155-Pleurochrysis_carterae.AAC.1